VPNAQHQSQHVEIFAETESTNERGLLAITHFLKGVSHKNYGLESLENLSAPWGKPKGDGFCWWGRGVTQQNIMMRWLSLGLSRKKTSLDTESDEQRAKSVCAKIDKSVAGTDCLAWMKLCIG